MENRREEAGTAGLHQCELSPARWGERAGRENPTGSKVHFLLLVSKQSVIWKFRSKREREINSECYYANIAAIFQNLNKVLTSVFSSRKELGRN